jgi:predicted deacylase
MNDWHCDIDLDAPGKRSGAVEFRRTQEEVGTYITAAPLTCIANGEGPTVVLTAGVHGDEYEGQVALSELARQLEPSAIRGCVIMPASNVPACVAGQRFSPIDGLNLNRVFPSDAGSSLTRRMARFIETELYARADYAVDVHSGGVILEFLPATIIVITANAAENERRLAMASAFGATHCMLFGAKTMGVEVSIDAAMLRQGVIGISGEYGGSGTLGATSLAVCRTGLRRVLAALGLTVEPSERQTNIQPLLVDVRSDDVYIVAEQQGVFEPLVVLGDHVKAGDVVAWLHRPELPNSAPTPIHTSGPGIVMARRVPARSSVGDWLFVIGRPTNGLPAA